MPIVHVPGKKSCSVMLYALSTCGWCQKTKKLLDSLGVQYDYLYVDQTVGDERRKAISDLAAVNPATSFPTLVVDNDVVIIGFKEDDIRRALQ